MTQSVLAEMRGLVVEVRALVASAAYIHQVPGEVLCALSGCEG